MFRDIINHASNRGISYGEMSEWFKEPVLKTGDPGRDRGFESHPLRFLKEALEDFVSLGVFLLLNLLFRIIHYKI